MFEQLAKLNRLDIADIFYESLTTGAWWDKDAIAARSELANVGSEHLEYTFEAALSRKRIQIEPLDLSSDYHQTILKDWCAYRTAHAISVMAQNMSFMGHYVHAWRIVDCPPNELNENIGIYWTFNPNESVDPYCYWSLKSKSEATPIRVKALIPIDGVDLQTTCLSLMCYMYGDAEQELRVLKGTRVMSVTATDFKTGEQLVLPKQRWFA